MSKKLSDEDKQVFRQAMSDVIPLHKKKSVNSSKKTIKIIKRLPNKLTSTDYPLSDFTQNPITSFDKLAFNINLLSEFERKKWRQGMIVIDRKLDLHGLSIEDARVSLINFITEHFQSQNRCLLIIHGKGDAHSTFPILKNLVNTWLKQFTEVLAFASAHKKHGDTGALYVKLKKSHHS